VHKYEQELKWILDGDKNTKYFLNLEKSRVNAKLLPKLELDDGTSITDQFEILNEQKRYYEQLYSREINDNTFEEKIAVFLENCQVPKLTENQQTECGGMITADELSAALKERYDAENRQNLELSCFYFILPETDFSTAHVPLGF
jgi:hypothetical protein